MSTMQAYPRLIDALDELRRRWRMRKLIEGGLLALAGVAGVLFLVVAADNVLQPGTTGRLVLAAALWMVLVASLFHWVIHRWLEDRRDDFFAALVERQHPELHNRLINALQLGRVNQPGCSPQLIQAIVDDAAVSTADLDMADSLDGRPVKRAATFAAVASVLVLGYAVALGPWFSNGFTRVFWPVAEIAPYTATRIVESSVRPGANDGKTFKVPEGASVVVQAQVEGVIPASAQLLRRVGQGSWQTSTMTPGAKALDLFGATVPQVGESFAYQIIAGDGRSRTYQVEVVKRPRVASLALTATPPAYTALPPTRIAEADGEITGIAGTRVAVELKATKPLGSASFVTDKGEVITLTKRSDDRTWSASLIIGSRDAKAPTPSAGRWLIAPARHQIKLLDADGYENADPLWHSIVPSRDQAPTVAISAPGRDLQVKPDAVVTLTVDAKDDYGIGAVRLQYRVNDETTVRDLAAFPHQGPPALQASDRFDWTLSGQGLKAGDLVQYWATVADRNTITGPGQGESRRFSLFLATPEQAVAKLDLQIEDYAQMLEALVRLQKENRAQTSSGTSFETLVTRQALIRTKSGQLARAMEKDALPVATIVAALDDLVAGLMANAVKMLEAGRDSNQPAQANTHRQQSLPVQDQIVAQLEGLLARLQRNEQAKDALRKMAKADKPAHQATTKVLGQMIKDLDRMIAEQNELAAKFEKMPKKPTDEFKEETLKPSTDLEQFRKNWEKWAKGTVAELTKLPTGFVDDFQLRPDVNKIFEEIEKAATRPKAEKVEVALEDLGAGLATKMKEDLEMWMPDTPDAAKWVLEEPLNKQPMKIPEMSLPKALEDMVGDLLQKADEFDEEADDITSAWGDNLDQAGWGVSDGPISSFSAKGKTGNDMPNSHEVSGRAGDGRRGKSSGQMVGDTARGLEGRKTPARVNNERYEPGQLKSEGRSDPNGATGGGKKADSGRRGLQGGTPPDFVRDMGRLNEKQAGLRDKMEQVANRLETAGLSNRRLTQGVELMKSAEHDLRDLRYEDAARKRRTALGQLKAAFSDRDPSTAAQLSRARDLPPQLRTELLQAADEGYAAGYESLLKSYFNALSSAEK